MDILMLTTLWIIYTHTDGYRLLDDNILHYEPLYYDRAVVHDQHVRLNSSNQHLQIQFQAFGRSFNLHLSRDRTAPLSPDFQLKHRNISRSNLDLSFLYTGNDTGWPGSVVHGAIVNGTFQGIIHLSGQTSYNVESSKRMFSGLPPFHSVIYSQDNYNWSHVFPDKDLVVGLARGLHYNFLEETDTMHMASRMRRAATDKRLVNKVCTLKLVTDHMLWRYMMDQNDQNEGRTRDDITTLLVQHVRELNTIFEHTIFTLDKGSQAERNVTGIQFAIRTIEIMTSENCTKEDGSDSSDGIYDVYLTAETLLSRFADREYASTGSSTDNYYYRYDDDNTRNEVNEDYPIGDHDYPSYGESTEPVATATCLSFLFTARVLFRNQDPILGLAYPPDKDKAGGICFVGANNGFITLFQFTDRQFLPTPVTSLVFTHEVAHAFGAQHDNDKPCARYQLTSEPPGGFYLMHSVAQRGLLPNNKRLSNCSLDYMSRILSIPQYTSCFQDNNLPFCGNNVVEEGEECDCGISNTCTDPCCYGKGYNSSRPDLDCTLREGAKCSPSEGPCCNSSSCQLIKRQEDFVCQNSKPCMDQLLCDGDSYGAICPRPHPSQIRPNGHICNDNGRVCEAGSCNASICKMIGWRECQLTNDQPKLTIEEKEELCYVACRKSKNETHECISTNDKVKIQLYPELSRLLMNISNIRKTFHVQFPIGTPCNKMSGYCDVFYRCRGVEPDTPLVKLKNCVISGECSQQIRQFIQEYWWAVSLTTIAACIVFGVLVKGCAVHTKSSNPALEARHPSRSFRESMHRISQFNVRESVNLDSLRRVVDVRGMAHSIRNSLHRKQAVPSAPTQIELELDPDSCEPLNPGKLKMLDIGTNH